MQYEGIRTQSDERGLRLAVADLAKRLGRTSQALTRHAQKSCLELSSSQVKTPTGAKTLKFIHEKDLFALIVGLRATGEFADAIKQFQTGITEKGIEQTKQLDQPKRAVKPFQRFPEPIQIPDKPIKACVVEYIRMVGKVTGKGYNALFVKLYTEFKYRFGIDPLRHSGYPTAIAKVEDMEKLQELYALARAMFDCELPEDVDYAPQIPERVGKAND